jgi:sulfite exporter TauE/SafE
VDQDPLILALLSAGVAHCRAVAVEHGGLLASLFLAGLLGSATHCVGMCGPLVLAQTMTRLETRPAAAMRELDRLTGAALLPYHLGRATTYAALGAATAGLTAGMVAVTGLRWLSAVLLALAAVLFVGYAVRQVGSRLRWRWFDAAIESGWSRTLGRFVRPLFGRPLGWRGYVLGVALGFLPCGFLYGAVAASAASRHPLSGALAMLAFALGTVPALMTVGLAGHVAGSRFRGSAVRLAPALMLVNAAGLSYLAWRSIA